MFGAEVYHCRTWRNALKGGETFAIAILSLPFHVPIIIWLERAVIGPLLTSLSLPAAHLVSRFVFWAVFAGTIASIADPSPRQWLSFRIEVERDGIRYAYPVLWAVRRGFAAWEEIAVVREAATSTILRVGPSTLKIPAYVGRYKQLRDRIKEHLSTTPTMSLQECLRRHAVISDSLLASVHAEIAAGRKIRAIDLLQKQAGIDRQTARDYVYDWADEQKDGHSHRQQVTILPQNAAWAEACQSVLLIALAIGVIILAFGR